MAKRTVRRRRRTLIRMQYWNRRGECVNCGKPGALHWNGHHLTCGPKGPA